MVVLALLVADICCADNTGNSEAGLDTTLLLPIGIITRGH